MKREQLLQELRKIAKLNGVTFTIFENEGKGSLPRRV